MPPKAEAGPASSSGDWELTMGVLEHIDKTSVNTETCPSKSEFLKRVTEAIAEAETIEEVDRLEKVLNSGVLPDDLKKEHDNLTNKRTSTQLSPPPESKKHQGTGL